MREKPTAAGRATVAEPAELEIRAYEPADESGVLDVLQAAFGRWPRGIEDVDAGAFFRWKLAECPFGPSLSVVALSEGRVVGFVGRLRWPLRVRGRTVLSTRGVDLAVAPAHRRRGVSLAMARWAIAHDPEGAALAWNNPNDQSRSGLMKAGRREIVLLPRFVQPCAFGQSLRRATGTASSSPAEPRVEAETAATALADGESVERLLAELVEPDGRMTTARDLDYLRWRYGRVGGYRAVRRDAGAGDAAAGVAIFRLRRRRSLWVSEVCELLVAGDDLATKRRLLGEVRRAAGADLLSASFDSQREALRCGFVRVRGGTLLTTRRTAVELGVEPTERDAWSLSLGDVDLL